MPRLPPGAAILLSGEPGVGKSTLLLEVASRAAASGQRVLYVSAEESVSQVRLRAERTNALQPSLFLAAETDLATILGQIDEVQPQLVIVDSVQTGASGLTDGLAGGPAQVREVASTLIRVSKDRNLPVLLVGHVTKLAKAKRLGFSQVLDSETGHLREGLRLEFAGASAERVDVPDF